MKGLLIKDFCLIFKQMKIFLAIIVLFTLIPGFSSTGFALVYAAMMPITAMSYDERSKWDKMASMMPYSAKDIVFCKYILGLTMILLTAILSVIASLCFSVFSGSAPSSDSMAQILLMTCIAFVFEAVNLPVMVGMGVEKGRLLFIAMAVVIVAVGVTAGRALEGWMSPATLGTTELICGAVVIAMALYAVSMIISVKLYESKKE